VFTNIHNETTKSSYAINNGDVNAGFKQQLGDLLLLECRRNVQRRVTILQVEQQHSNKSWDKNVLETQRW